MTAGRPVEAYIPDWYGEYVVPFGRFVGYVLGFALAATVPARELFLAADPALSSPTQTRTQGALLLGTAFVLALGLFAVRRDVYGSKVFQWGFAAQFTYVPFHLLLVDRGGFAVGSPYLLADAAFGSLGALALSHAVVFGGLGAAAKRRARATLDRWVLGPLRGT